MVKRVRLDVDCAFNESISEDPDGQFVMAFEALELERQLAAANALLSEWQNYGPIELSDRTRAHLSGQASARSDHERAVLEAVEVLPEAMLREAAEENDFEPGQRLARAELARREAERG